MECAGGGVGLIRCYTDLRNEEIKNNGNENRIFRGFRSEALIRRHGAIAWPLNRTKRGNSILRRMLKIGIVILGLSVLIAILLKVSLPWIPFFDDGPFHGKPCSKEYQIETPQQFKLGSNSELEVGVSRDSVVVIRTNENGTHKWCQEIFGFKENDTRSLVLNKKIWLPFLGYRAMGLVQWTYGSERTIFDFDSKGRIKKYYFSW